MKINKKSLFILSLAAIFLLSISVYAYNEIIANKVEYKIYINGQEKEFSNLPVIYEDITYLPIREFSEMLGMNVAWNEKDRSINITGDFDMVDIYNNLSKDEVNAILKFKNISSGDSLQTVFENIGQPDRDIGSGIYIYQFDVGNDVKVEIRSVNGDTVESVFLMVGEKRYNLIK